MHGGEDGLPLVLLIKFTTRPSAFGEGRGVHEAAQVEVLLKVGQTIFHLVVIKVGLHISDLNVRLNRRFRFFVLHTVICSLFLINKASIAIFFTKHQVFFFHLLNLI